MGRIFGILLFVVALWFMANQFSGWNTGESESGGTASQIQQAGDSVVRAHEAGEERRRKLLGE